MEDTTQPTQPSKKSRAKVTGLIAIILILVAGAGLGSYLWQHDKVNHLQTELASAKATTSQTQSTTSSTFTYKPKAGGLSLTLPISYGVVVNVDGNKGGAPGATFKVASVIGNNIFKDDVYQGVQLDVDSSFTTLNDAVSIEKSRLGQEPGTGNEVNRNYNVSDTTVAGLPAKLLTADGLDEYQGQVSVYLVGSGDFTYTITANGTQAGTPAIVTAILKGISIKPASL